MRKWFRNVLILLAATIFISVAWLALRRPSDPVYKGKRLSAWLLEYSPGVPSGGVLVVDSTVRPETDEAVRHFGTNAIPMMFAMLRVKDSYTKSKLMSLAQQQTLIKINSLPVWRWYFGAEEAFEKLGVSASNAVPELIKIYGQNHSYISQLAIVRSLGDIGPAAGSAVPLLLRAATYNTNDPGDFIVANSLWALGQIHGEPEVALPVLIKLLSDSRMVARVYSAHALGSYGANAGPATSGLLETMQDPDRRVRHGAFHALGQIYGKADWEPETNPELDPASLFQPKEDYQASTLMGVINYFGTLGTNGAPAVPALVKFLNDSDEGVRISATNALNAIDPEAAARAGVR